MFTLQLTYYIFPLFKAKYITKIKNLMLWKLFKRKPILFLYLNNASGEEMAEINKSIKAEVGRDYYVIVVNQNRDCLNRSPWEIIE